MVQEEEGKPTQIAARVVGQIALEAAKVVGDALESDPSDLRSQHGQERHGSQQAHGFR